MAKAFAVELSLGLKNLVLRSFQTGSCKKQSHPPNGTHPHKGTRLSNVPFLLGDRMLVWRLPDSMSLPPYWVDKRH